MEINRDARLLRIFINESDKIHSTSLFEYIVLQAKQKGMAGASVFKGIMSFGATSRIHSSKILRLSEDLPVLIEIVDELKNIEGFIPHLDKIIEEANCGALVTIEKAEIIKYKHISK
jgi:uncharacterized protein